MIRLRDDRGLADHEAMTSTPSAPSSRAQRGILVVLFWLALWFVGLPLLVLVLAALGVGGGIGTGEIGVLFLLVVGVGTYGTRRILRMP